MGSLLDTHHSILKKMEKTIKKNTEDAGQPKEFIDWLYREIEKFNKDLIHYNEECDYYRATKSESMRDALLSALKKLQGE